MSTKTKGNTIINLSHVPPKIAKEDFELGRMKYGNYSRKDLVDALTRHLKRPLNDLTPRQIEGMRRFRYHDS